MEKKINRNTIIAVVEIVTIASITLSYIFNDIIPLFSPEYHEPAYASGMGLFYALVFFVTFSAPLILLAISARLNWTNSNRTKIIVILESVLVVSIIASFHYISCGLSSLLSRTFLYIPKVLTYAIAVILVYHLMSISKLRNIMKWAITLMISVIIIGLGIMLNQCSYKPSIPIKSIPSDTSEMVKIQIEKLYSIYPEERVSAILELGKMGNEATDAIPFLIEMVGDSTPESRSSYNPVKFSAIKSLETITKQEFGVLVEEWKKWWKQNKNRF